MKWKPGGDTPGCGGGPPRRGGRCPRPPPPQPPRAPRRGGAPRAPATAGSARAAAAPSASGVPGVLGGRGRLSRAQAGRLGRGQTDGRVAPQPGASRRRKSPGRSPATGGTPPHPGHPAAGWGGCPRFALARLPSSSSPHTTTSLGVAPGNSAYRRRRETHLPRT